jgi:hypothetical protein
VKTQGSSESDYSDWLLDTFDIYVTGKTSAGGQGSQKGKYCISKHQCKQLIPRLCSHFKDDDFGWSMDKAGDWWLDLWDIWLIEKGRGRDNQDKELFCKTKDDCQQMMTILCKQF